VSAGGDGLYNQDIASALQTAPASTFTVAAPCPAGGDKIARPTNAGDYLSAFTGLRFCLAIWVILHHLCNKGMMLDAWASAALPGPVLSLIHSGYLAVQTFFVLSGFVLTRTYAPTVWNRRTLGRFATARFARVYPVYFLSLIVVSPFIIEMLLQPVWTPGQRAGLVTTYLLMLQGWMGSLKVGWNTPAWSLSCEFVFYLCFPLLFTVLRNARWKAISVALTVAVVTPTFLDHAGVPWSWKPFYYLPDFLAGIAAARVFSLVEHSRAWRKRGYWLYIPALVLGGWLIVHPHTVDGSMADLSSFLRPLNVALLVGFAIGGGWLARLLSTGAADLLGKASYSMYILHIPILWWTGRYLVHGKWHPSRPVAGVVYLTLVVVASALVYSWLEAPASVWIRARQKKMERS